MTECNSIYIVQENEETRKAWLIQMGFHIDHPRHRLPCELGSVEKIVESLNPWPSFLSKGYEEYIYPHWHQLSKTRYFSRCLTGDTADAALDASRVIKSMPAQLERVSRKLREDLLETALESLKKAETDCSVFSRLRDAFRKAEDEIKQRDPKLFFVWQDLYNELGDGLQETRILCQTTYNSLYKLIDDLEATRMAKKQEVHYHIQNVGVLNSGKARNIEAHLNVLSESGQKGVADAIQNVTQAVVNAELDGDIKGEVVEQLQELSKQATLDKSSRLGSSVLKSILTSIGATLAGAGGLAEVWSTWGPQISEFFGIG